MKSIRLYSTGETIAFGYQRFAEAYFANPSGGPAVINAPANGPSWHLRWRGMPLQMFRWWIVWHNISSKSAPPYLFANGKVPKMTPPPPMFPIRLIQIAIPYWVPLLLTTPFPLIRLLNVPQQRRRTRFAAGECVICGYDLRHTPDRCPECGSLPLANSLELQKKLDLFSHGVWLRIVFYPVFFALFTLGFSMIYFWHYQK